MPGFLSSFFLGREAKGLATFKGQLRLYRSRCPFNYRGGGGQNILNGAYAPLPMPPPERDHGFCALVLCTCTCSYVACCVSFSTLLCGAGQGLFSCCIVVRHWCVVLGCTCTCSDVALL